MLTFSTGLTTQLNLSSLEYSNASMSERAAVRPRIELTSSLLRVLRVL